MVDDSWRRGNPPAVDKGRVNSLGVAIIGDAFGSIMVSSHYNPQLVSMWVFLAYQPESQHKAGTDIIPNLDKKRNSGTFCERVMRSLVTKVNIKRTV